MTPAARVQAAIGVLDAILAGKPAEQALTGWARASRFAGSKDRAAVRDHVFDALRCRRSFAALGGAETGRGLMLGAVRAEGAAAGALFDGSSYGPAPVGADETGRAPAPGAEAGDIPDWLWPEFTRSLGESAASVAEVLRHRAPIGLRVNPRRASRAALGQALMAEGISTQPSDVAETALIVTDGARKLRNTAAFRDGAFELQDAASQAVVDALPLTQGLRVLDFCAGGGGKTLAMAARADLDLTAHDADPGRMRDLPARAERAGVRVRLADLATATADGPYDLVLCDVPCSGSGSWRRAPDGKWTLTPERLEALTGIQSDILGQAAPLVSPQGVLAYVTCSVLACENEDRIAGFLDAVPGWFCREQRRWPVSPEGDGFFLSILTRKQH